MCACEPGFVCVKCEATPADDRYEEDEPERFEGSDYEPVA